MSEQYGVFVDGNKWYQLSEKWAAEEYAEILRDEILLENSGLTVRVEAVAKGD